MSSPQQYLNTKFNDHSYVQNYKEPTHNYNYSKNEKNTMYFEPTHKIPEKTLPYTDISPSKYENSNGDLNMDLLKQSIFNTLGKIIPKEETMQNNYFNDEKEQQKIIESQNKEVSFSKKNGLFAENNSFMNKMNSEDVAEKSSFRGFSKEAVGKIESQINLKKFTKNDFEIGIQLGRGKYGKVFLAREKKSNYLVALKILEKIEIKKNAFQSQIIREIKIQASLNHSNILKLFGCFHDEDNIYLILEFAADGELYSEMKRQENKRFDEKKVAGYIKQIIEALKYLHSMDIIHRDLKPENILISFDTLKLADFGWAIYAPNQMRNTFCGTLDYISPEVVQGINYDNKIDIWCVGILTFELLSGKPPFERKDAIDAFYQLFNGKMIPMFPEHFSDAAKDFITNLLMVKPEQRIGLSDALQHPFIVNNI